MPASIYGTTDSYPDISARSAAWALLILIIAGFWLRLIGLGYAPLAEDEYYFITSTHNILEHGLPRFASGGYYLRGILQQYLTAATITVLGDDTFSYRLPSLLFGMATCVMAYFLGRQFLNRSWSILLVAFLVFSSWQIEFSRFARMYAALQFFTVFFFWALFRFSFDPDSRYRYLPIVIALFSLLTHQLGVFLVAFLFYPLPSWYRTSLRDFFVKHKYYVGISLLSLLAGFFMVTYSFRFVGVSDRLPADYVWPISKKLPWIDFASILMGSYAFLLLGTITTIVVVVWYILHIRERFSVDAPEDLVLKGLAIAALCSALFYQFALSLLFLLPILLRKPTVLIRRPFHFVIVSIAGLFVFWTILLFFNPAWIEAVAMGDTLRSFLRALRLAFFAFPDLYTPVFRAWADDLPILGFLLAAAAAWQVLCIRKQPLDEILRNPVTPAIIFLIVLGIQPPHKIETRYSFFIYPILLSVAILSAVSFRGLLHRMLNFPKWPVQAAAIVVSCLLFWAGEDFNPSHLLNVSSEAATFRIGAYERFHDHWYPRWDFRETAQFVNKHAAPGDRVVVSHKVNTTGAYLETEFAVFWPQNDPAFRDISREKGQRELWSNRRLLTTQGELRQYAREADRIWLVAYHGQDDLITDPYPLWPGRVKSFEETLPGRDKRIEVWKITLK